MNRMESRPCLAVVLALALLAGGAPEAAAQPQAPNESGVAMDHVQLTVPDVTRHREIWTLLGAEEVVAEDGVGGFGVPGVFLQLAEGVPRVPSHRTAINHIGFSVRDYATYKGRLEALDAEFFFDSEANGQIIADMPDGVRVEFLTDPDQAYEIVFHHVHLGAADGEALRDWYTAVFGAEPGERRGLPSAVFPGARFDILPAADALPSSGGAIERVGLTVADLDAFLEHAGRLGLAPERRAVGDRGERTTGGLVMTDPAGALIEVTQRAAPAEVATVDGAQARATGARASGDVTAAVSIPGEVAASARAFVPVTTEMLEDPRPADWLMFSRTYDAQRFSPLDQINAENVGGLALAWARNFNDGVTETIPLVYEGVMYLVTPGAEVEALDAATGDLLWSYKRSVSENLARSARTKNLAIYGDVIIYTPPDPYVVGLDARTGAVRWESPVATRQHTSGPLVVEGLAVTGGSCFGNRDNCFLAAHDAVTGEEVWRFHTTPARGEPGDETWAGAALENRQASPWGLPGSYDPERRLLYWGIANPMPDYRMQRHGGDPDRTARHSPADLYSNSTVALDPDTGALVWYYQHVPGDDWDLDAAHERTLVRTVVDPDPQHVKWINPNVARGEERDIAVMIGEGGGIWALDAVSGEFLWANPFPFDTPNWGISHIEPESGTVHLNWDLVFKAPGERNVICYWNTRSYWPTAYHPRTNSLYTSFIDNCRDATAPDGAGFGDWHVVPRPGGEPDALTGLAKIDLTTGEIHRFNLGRAPGNGALLATGGGLIFHGDMSRRFRAYDAETTEVLWETILGGNVSVSTVTYAVNGKQYVAVMTGENLKVTELMEVVPELTTPRGHNAIYVFALP